jgi:hypothetical protein
MPAAIMYYNLVLTKLKDIIWERFEMIGNDLKDY